MGDWCGSANGRKPKVKKESGVEREPEEPHNGRGIEDTGLMVPCKETLVSKGEVFSLDRCPLMGDPKSFSKS